MAARKFTTKTGARNASVTLKVTQLRDKKEMSWAAIAAELDIAPRTARRLYQERNGVGSHHGLLPGKGGRRPVVAAA